MYIALYSRMRTNAARRQNLGLCEQKQNFTSLVDVNIQRRSLANMICYLWKMFNLILYGVSINEWNAKKNNKSNALYFLELFSNCWDFNDRVSMNLIAFPLRAFWIAFISLRPACVKFLKTKCLTTNEFCAFWKYLT